MTDHDQYLEELADLARNAAGWNDDWLDRADYQTLRNLLLEFRAQARAALDLASEY